MIQIIKNLIEKNETLYVAVSMGTDSLAAIHWLLCKEYKIVAVHFNHKIRQQNEHMEEKFKEFCGDFGLKNFCGYGKGFNTESECRKARIEFYAKIVKNKESKIVTAHHLNDWVENYLMNCFRGKQEHEPIPLISEFEKYKIVHPFLLSRKKDFQQYVDRNNLRRYAVEDETNLITKGSRRNWIREKILPEMKKNEVSLEKFAKRKIEGEIKKSVRKHSEGSSIG